MKLACIEEEDIHLLDHLCPLAFFLQASIITSSALIKKTIEDLYPNVTVLKFTSSNEILNYLIKHIDVIIMSRQTSLFELSQTLKTFSNKAFRYIYLPHGQSDKGFSDQYIDYLEGQDLSFCYGKLMENQLAQRGVLQNLNGVIKTGNFRLAYYRAFEGFYKLLIEKKLSFFKKKQTTILYAPTWNDLENLSSFEHIAKNLSKNLPPHFNLIIKLHPYLEKEDPVKICLLTNYFFDKPNVLLLEECHTIYPLLDQIDIYLGDFSSIGYDALSFDIPLFFINASKHQESFPLFEAGLTIPAKNFDNVFRFIETNLERSKIELRGLRRKLYFQTFDKFQKPRIISDNSLKKMCKNSMDSYY